MSASTESLPRAAPVDPYEESFIPVLRGVSHVYSAYVAAVAGIALVLIAPDATGRVCAVVYGVSMIALFTVSGLYHRWRWNPRWRDPLRRLDHCMIYLFIASCSTVLAVLVLTGTVRTVVLATSWTGAVGGVLLSVWWISAPRKLVATTYVAVSCAAVIGLPQTIDHLPVMPVVLLALGGVIYAIGAAVYATRRPNPSPQIFGFHEVFHALVIVAATLHYAAVAGWVIPGAAS